jgi:putative Mg2+ transporter-C (MgtC) family protein
LGHELTWLDMALRLGLALAAGALFGVNRSERGHDAGLRTTMLVCLAAAVAMLEAHVLLVETTQGFVQMFRLDVMRLPLGVLSGIGFIGAGTIMRRGTMVRGMTTAATLWIVTIIGLCFGGGQLGLGIAATVLGFIILSLFTWGEALIRPERHGSLTVLTTDAGPTEAELRETLGAAGMRIRSFSITRQPVEHRCYMDYELRFRADAEHVTPRRIAEDLAGRPGILSVQWRSPEI